MFLNESSPKQVISTIHLHNSLLLLKEEVICQARKKTKQNLEIYWPISMGALFCNGLSHILFTIITSKHILPKASLSVSCKFIKRIVDFTVLLSLLWFSDAFLGCRNGTLG